MWVSLLHLKDQYKMRIGTGFDIHRFQPGREFILGGVKIPFEKGLAGHSDADVLLHTISDALLGAMGKPDIGHYFPDTDTEIKGIASTKILKKVLEIMEQENFRMINIDTVIICEKPKLAQYIPEIKANLALIMDMNQEDIGIKAKTFEGMGDLGRGEACACNAALLIARKDKK